jgi:hypothetical protein
MRRMHQQRTNRVVILVYSSLRPCEILPLSEYRVPSIFHRARRSSRQPACDQRPVIAESLPCFNNQVVLPFFEGVLIQPWTDSEHPSLSALGRISTRDQISDSVPFVGAPACNGRRQKAVLYQSPAPPNDDLRRVVADRATLRGLGSKCEKVGSVKIPRTDYIRNRRLAWPNVATKHVRSR